jgi:hypothetical protein
MLKEISSRDQARLILGRNTGVRITEQFSLTVG